MKKNCFFKSLILFVPLVLGMFFSCASSRSLRTDELHGIVFDSNNEGICGYSFFDEGGKLIDVSDERGFFRIQCKKHSGSYYGVKNGWEEITINIDNVKFNNLYVVRVKNKNELLLEFEKALSNNDFLYADKVLERCGKSALTEENVQVLKSIILFKTGNISKSLEYLNQLGSDVLKRDDVQKFYNLAANSNCEEI